MKHNHLLGHYGNANAHCGKHIDLEHVLTLWIMDYAVNVLGRDHVDPFIVRRKLFEALLPMLDRYPNVKKRINRVLLDSEYRSDQCLDELRALEEHDVFGPEGC